VNAVAFAQSGMSMLALGATHADCFYGDIPCTRELSEHEVLEAYEANTGKVIIETIEQLGFDPMSVPRIIVKNHGSFAWGKSSLSHRGYGKGHRDGSEGVDFKFEIEYGAVCAGQALYAEARIKCLLGARSE